MNTYEKRICDYIFSSYAIQIDFLLPQARFESALHTLDSHRPTVIPELLQKLQFVLTRIFWLLPCFFFLRELLIIAGIRETWSCFILFRKQKALSCVVNIASRSILIMTFWGFSPKIWLKYFLFHVSLAAKDLSVYCIKQNWEISLLRLSPSSQEVKIILWKVSY